MSNQTPISVKLDSNKLHMLDLHCYRTGDRRNRVINNAVEHYLRYLDYKASIDYWQKCNIGNARDLTEKYIQSVFRLHDNKV